MFDKNIHTSLVYNKYNNVPRIGVGTCRFIILPVFNVASNFLDYSVLVSPPIIFTLWQRNTV